MTETEGCIGVTSERMMVRWANNGDSWANSQENSGSDQEMWENMLAMLPHAHDRRRAKLRMVKFQMGR